MEVERSGCREGVSLLQPQALEFQLLPEALGKKDLHLCLVSTVKSWSLQKVKAAERKAGSSCEKRGDGHYNRLQTCCLRQAGTALV